MPERFKKITNSKSFHIAIIVVIIVLILFIASMVILKYSVEGETNMPFDLTKITIISTVDGIEKNQNENRWDYDINQNNDIYLYIDKNSNYSQSQFIKSVEIQNISIDGIKKDKIKIYKPTNGNDNLTFQNIQQNEVSSLQFLGESQSDLKNLKISNQGGLLAFRCAINNVAEYISNEDEEIKMTNLLKKAGVKFEDLQTKITFDLLIKVQNEIVYKSTISIDLPVDNVVENGITSREITNLKDYIFKRN